MDLQLFDSDIEKWFLSKKPSDFPNGVNYVSKYETIVDELRKVHKQVTGGADFTDSTSLTWHDESHIKRVIKQASKLLSYKDVQITPYETFVLLIAIQIHDIKNIEGREEHENHSIEIFEDLGIRGIIDSILLKNIGFIASCHAGSVTIGGRKEKDKIQLLDPSLFRGEKVIHMRFLAAILRLADEYADESERAMSYLLKYGKIKKGSVIHQKHAESLIDVDIEPNSGKVDFDYHIKLDDTQVKFSKYIKGKDTYEDVYLLDEIFERTVKSHYETIYCMRYLRPYISINRLDITIEIEFPNITNQLRISYTLEEKGYPSEDLNILDLCGEKYLRNNLGAFWSGENLKEYVKGYITPKK